MRNVQHRAIGAPPDKVGALFGTLASVDDRLWPAGEWPAMHLDAGVTPGSRGGHGPIHYGVTAFDPGRRVRFDFEPGKGFDGYHELSVAEDGPDRCILTHVIVAKTSGRMLLLWPLAVRWLHEALIEELFDNAERATTGRLRGAPAHGSWWVRQLLRLPL
jgi:hypothetical protein